MNDTDYQNVYYLVAAIVAGAGLLAKLGSVFWKGFVKREIDIIAENRRKLDVVFKELIPNHGSSIKDKINKLEQSVAHNNELTEKIFNRQRWLMERQDLPIFESDLNGRYVWVNEKYASLFGKSASHFLGHGWKNTIHPEDRERVEEGWAQSVKDGIDSEPIYRAIIKDRIVNIKAVISKTDDGYIGSLIVFDCHHHDGGCPADLRSECKSKGHCKKSIQP